MPDLALSVLVGRAALGKSPLQINDHVTYYLAADFLGATVTWNRQSATSPFLDGPVTTQRTRPSVTENITVEILGGNAVEVVTARAALIAAFSQSRFTLDVFVSGQRSQYDCEAADHTPVNTGPRWITPQLQVAFSLPRQPVPVIGGY